MKKENLNLGIWMAEGHTLRSLIRLAVNKKDGTVLVRIPRGRYEVGDGKNFNSPKHKVELSEYWLGVYCVSNRQYGKFMKETGHKAPDKALDGENPVWKNGKCSDEQLDHPVVCVSWEDAAAYGKWAGLELPSEAQWEVGARGPGGLIYPWGNEWDGSKCRNDKNRGKEETCEMWGHGEGVSGWGTYQQSGNVWEWFSDWYGDRYHRKYVDDPRVPETGSYRMYRGGSWRDDDASNLRGVYRASGNNYSGELGFRLARNRP